MERGDQFKPVPLLLREEVPSWFVSESGGPGIADLVCRRKLQFESADLIEAFLKRCEIVFHLDPEVETSGRVPAQGGNRPQNNGVVAESGVRRGFRDRIDTDPVAQSGGNPSDEAGTEFDVSGAGFLRNVGFVPLHGHHHLQPHSEVIEHGDGPSNGV